MNGVMMPVVSAGSNQPGASEMCTAHVSCPTGASERPAGASERAFVGRISPRSSSAARISAEREYGRRGTRSVMRTLLCVRESFGSEAEDRRTEPEVAPIIRGCPAVSTRIQMAGDEAAALRRQRRLVAAAALHHVRTTRVEATARRWIERARNLAAQDDLLPAG